MRDTREGTAYSHIGVAKGFVLPSLFLLLAFTAEHSTHKTIKLLTAFTLLRGNIDEELHAKTKIKNPLRCISREAARDTACQGASC